MVGSTGAALRRYVDQSQGSGCVTPVTVTHTTSRRRRTRKAEAVPLGEVWCFNPHVAGALALAMRQGLVIRATYHAGTVSLTAEPAP